MKERLTDKNLLFNGLAALVFVASMFGFTDFAPDVEFMALIAALANVLVKFIPKRNE